MKVWQIQSFGIEQLVLHDLPQPHPGRGEVLLKVQRSLAELPRPAHGARPIQPQNGIAAHPLLRRSRRSGRSRRRRRHRQGRTADSRHLHAALAGRPPDCGTEPWSPGRRPRRHAGRICSAAANWTGPPSRTSLLHGGSHASLCRGHRMERLDQRSPGTSRRRGGDPGYRRCFDIRAAIREDHGRNRDRYFQQRRKTRNAPEPWGSMPASTIGQFPTGQNGCSSKPTTAEPI